LSETQVTGFTVVAPSTVTTGEEFALKIKALREPYQVPAKAFAGYPRLQGPFNVSPRGIHYMDNAAARWSGALQLEGADGPAEIELDQLAGTFPGDERAIGEVEGFAVRKAGVHFITVTDPATGISATSNPIIATDEPPEYRLYWGDLHSQTYFSDGLRCPEELYHVARYEAFLDIFGMADHAEWLTDRQWEYFVAVTNDRNVAGQFATIVGHEWTNSKLGHRNIHYPGDWGPIVRSNRDDPDDLEALFEVARANDALLIPHHSANVTMGVNWEGGHEPEHERLVEIHSIWGNSERPAEAGNPLPIMTSGGEKAGQHVQDALGLGYRFGFTGGGDIHDGRPGDELHSAQEMPEQYRLLRRQGIMGVWTTELTREAVFDALWERRCFATTNVRMPMLFEVNEAFMGQEAQAHSPRNISVWAASESPIARVDIVRNGEDWQSREPHERIVQWELEDEESGAAGDYYYARFTREDGWIGWSSPVWIGEG
jgi:hypothetical protein